MMMAASFHGDAGAFRKLADLLRHAAEQYPLEIAEAPASHEATVQRIRRENNWEEAKILRSSKLSWKERVKNRIEGVVHGDVGEAF